MLKEILPDFGKNPDKDVMAMERKPISDQIMEHIFQAMKRKEDWKIKPVNRGLILSKFINDQDLL